VSFVGRIDRTDVASLRLVRLSSGMRLFTLCRLVEVADAQGRTQLNG